MLLRRALVALCCVVLAGCTSGSDGVRPQPGPGTTDPSGSAVGPAPTSPPSPGSSSGTPSATDAFAALAQDAPPQLQPSAEAMYAVSLGQSDVDFSRCVKGAAAKTACKKPKSLGSRDLKRNVNVEIVLDASGSMKELVGGRSKIDVARASIATFVAQLPKNARVSVRTFGNGADEPKSVSCASSRLVLPFQAPDAAKVGAALSKTVVQGYTPLAGALGKAKHDFTTRPATNNSNFVYVVSDGEETCDGDPVASAKALTSADIGVQVNVIGFSVDSKAAAQLKAAAAAGGGVYAAAGDDKALDKAFTQTGDWQAWTAYYNCRYQEAEQGFQASTFRSAEEFNCVASLVVSERTETDRNTAELFAEMRAQIDARKDYLERKLQELPAEQQTGLAERVAQEANASQTSAADAFKGAVAMAGTRYDQLLGAANAKKAGRFRDLQAEREARIAELQQKRDELGLPPGN